jgi:hypothetical protein
MKHHGPTVYLVPDDDADNGTGLAFHGTQRDAFTHARDLTKKPDDWDVMSPVVEWDREVVVEKVVLVKPTKEGCLAMLNTIWYAHFSEVVARFRNGRRVL